MKKPQNASRWGSAKARERYPCGGMVKKADGGPIATTMSRRWEDPSTAKDFAEQAEIGRKGYVPPYAQQQFRSGRKGPLNITPKPIKGERD